MAARARLLFATSLLLVPAFALAHNGRDVGDGEALDLDEALASVKPGEARALQGKLIDIFDGIRVSVDPRTGVRSYTQVGDIPANPARAAVSVREPAIGPNAEYWIEKSFLPGGGGYVPPSTYNAPASVSVYDEGYADYGYGYGYGYGGYYGYLGYGHGGRDRPRRGHGDGRPGRPGRPGGGHDRPGDDGPRHNPPPSTWSPPPGPPGGGVGSPPRYFDQGVGAPPPTLRYNSFRGRRG